MDYAFLFTGGETIIIVGQNCCSVNELQNMYFWPLCFRKELLWVGEAV
jgi:hypothetical protein